MKLITIRMSSFLCIMIGCLAWVDRTSPVVSNNLAIEEYEDILMIQESLPRVLQDEIPILFDVAVTIYYPVEAQTDDTPNITADGTHFEIHSAGEYRYCALSRDLLNHFGGGPFAYGDTITLLGVGNYNGKWVVKDTMHERWDNTVDLLVDVGTPLFKQKNAKMKRMI